MAPGPLILFKPDLLEKAKENVYSLLGLMSLCVIAAAIGRPLCDFIIEDTTWRMQRYREKRTGALPRESQAEKQSR